MRPNCFTTFSLPGKQSYYFISSLCTVQENFDCDSNSPQRTQEYSFYNKAHQVFLPQPSSAGISVTQTRSKRGEMSPPGSLNRYTSGLRLKLKLMLSAGCSHSGTDGVVDLCVQCQHPLPIQQLFEQCLCSQLSPIFLFFFRSEWAD